jgi:hypothetical protein
MRGFNINIERQAASSDARRTLKEIKGIQSQTNPKPQTLVTDKQTMHKDIKPQSSDRNVVALDPSPESRKRKHKRI